MKSWAWMASSRDSSSRKEGKKIRKNARKFSVEMQGDEIIEMPATQLDSMTQADLVCLRMTILARMGRFPEKVEAPSNLNLSSKCFCNSSCGNHSSKKRVSNHHLPALTRRCLLRSSQGCINLRHLFTCLKSSRVESQKGKTFKKREMEHLTP